MSFITNIPAGKIETPLRPLLERIAEAIDIVVPENSEELKALNARLNWIYECNTEEGGFGFSAKLGHDGEKSIVSVPLVALERLWAYTFGYLVLFDHARACKKPGKGVTTIKRTAETNVARKLLRWADENRKMRRMPWPDRCPSPENPMKWADRVAKTQQIFLGACCFIVLHELAHLEYKDPPSQYQTDEESQRCELQADDWAAKWMLDKIRQRRDTPGRPDGIQDFWIYRANSIAMALLVINSVEMHSGTSGRKTHPEPLERALHCAEKHFRESGEHRSPLTDFPIFLATTIAMTQTVNFIDSDGAETVHESITSALIDQLQKVKKHKSTPRKEAASDTDRV